MKRLISLLMLIAILAASATCRAEVVANAVTTAQEIAASEEVLPINPQEELKQVLPWSHPATPWMTITLMAITFCVAIIHKATDCLHRVSNPFVVGVVFLSLCIIAYVLYMGNNALWFLSLVKSGGWGWFILHIILFIYFGIYQAMYYFYTMRWIGHRLNVNMTVFAFATTALLIAFGAGYYFYPEYLNWIIGAFAILFLLLMYYYFVRTQGFIELAIFLIVTIATILLVIPVAYIALLAGIALMMMYFYLKMTVDDIDRDRRTIEVTELPGNDYVDRTGKHYQKNSNGELEPQ